MSTEDEQKKNEEALKKEQEEEQKKLEEQLAAQLAKIEEEKKAEEEKLANQLKQYDDELKALEEENEKELAKQKEELEKLAQEEKQMLEEAENINIYERQNKYDNIEEQLIKTRMELKKEKERANKALSNLNKIYLEKNKYEGIFQNCVEETKKLIYNRRVRENKSSNSADVTDIISNDNINPEGKKEKGKNVLISPNKEEEDEKKSKTVENDYYNDNFPPPSNINLKDDNKLHNKKNIFKRINK